MISTIIRDITFEQILPFWKDDLWPARISKIEPLSAVDIDSNINMNIFNHYQSTAFYLATYHNDAIIGVISGFKTSEVNCRLRGVYVKEEFRGRGISLQLIKAHFERAKALKCNSVWVLSRTNNVGLYYKAGFKDHLYTEKYEYGPHCILKKPLELDLD